MISQLEYNHGAALARLARGAIGEGVYLSQDPTTRSAYVLDGLAVLYMKYSTNRMSPWNFSFTSEHQAEVDALAQEYSGVFVTLVCGSDGIVCLSLDEYSTLLDDEWRSVEWIKAARRPREMYTLTGSDSSDILKIGDSEYPSKVLNALSELSRS